MLWHLWLYQFKWITLYIIIIIIVLNAPSATVFQILTFITFSDQSAVAFVLTFHGVRRHDEVI